MVLNSSLIKVHQQLTCCSCIPMSVELVLKLLGLMTISDFSLQQDTSKSGTSDWVKGFNYPTNNQKVRFAREYLLKDLGYSEDRGQHFMENYFDCLFKTIDKELENNRYVIISLESGPNQWHMEVVFDKVNEQEYSTVTFYHNNPQYAVYSNQALKERVRKMQGTDILTYKYT